MAKSRNRYLTLANSALNAGYGAYKGYKAAKGAYRSVKGRLSTRKSNRRGESYTKTMTKKRKRSSPQFKQDLQGMDYATIRIKYKPTKIGKLTQKLTGISDLFEITSGGQVSFQGRQTATTLAFINASSLTNHYSELSRLATPLQPNSLSQKYLLKSVFHELELANAGDSTCEVDLYVFINKVTGNTITPPETDWANGLPKESDSLVVALAPLVTDPWEKPTTNKYFNILYWTKKISFTLSPGQHKRVNVDFQMNRIMDTEYLGNYSQIRGITHWIMPVTRGTLGDGDNNFIVTPGNQTLTVSKVIWTAKKTIRGSMIQQNLNIRRTRGTRLNQILGAVFVEDEDTGAVEDTMNPLNYA